MQERGFEADASPGGIGRRDFLKLGGAGLAVAAAGGGLVGSGRALARDGGGPLRREFERAAGEYGVPVEVLLAMGYVNTRWEMVPPETNAYDPGESAGRGVYGVMALVQNPSADTLGRASSLTGIPEERLKADRAANIRGGAALLAEASGADITGATQEFTDEVTRAADGLDALDPDSVDRFTSTVAGAVDDLRRTLDAVRDGLHGGAAVAGIGGGELYVRQVRDTLSTGATARVRSGERVTLAPAIR